MEYPQLRADNGGVLLEVRVRPRGRRNGIEGVRGGRLLISVTAPPEDGEANAAVVATLAKALGIAKSGIEMVRGHKSREKTLRIHGPDVEKLQQRLRSL